MAVDAPGSLQLQTTVLHLSRIHVMTLDGLNHIVSFNIIEVHSIRNSDVGEMLFPGKLIIPQAFRSQFLVGGGIEIHLAHRRIAEALARHQFHFSVLRRPENKTHLGNPFRAGHVMMVETEACVDSHPRSNVLTVVHVTRYLVPVTLAALFVGRIENAARFLRGIISTAVDVLVVHAGCKTGTLKQTHALEQRDTREIVFRPEITVRGSGGVATPVVYLVAAEVAVDIDSPVGLLIMVLHGGGHSCTRNPLAGSVDGSRCGAGVLGVEVRDVGIDVSVPVLVEVITQFQVTAILLEAHVGTVVVRAVVLRRHRGRELPAAHLVAYLRLDGTVTPRSCIDSGLYTVAVHAPRHNVDDTAHGVAAVKDGSRAAEYFHALSHQGLVTVGDGMAIDAVILRVTVDEYEKLPRAARDAPQVDAARSTGGHAIAHHGAARHHHARNLLHHGRHDGVLVILREFLPVDDVDGKRQVAHIGGTSRAGNHHIGHGDGVSLRVGCTRGNSSNEHKE